MNERGIVKLPRNHYLIFKNQELLNISQLSIFISIQNTNLWSLVATKNLSLLLEMFTSYCKLFLLWHIPPSTILSMRSPAGEVCVHRKLRNVGNGPSCSFQPRGIHGPGHSVFGLQGIKGSKLQVCRMEDAVILCLETGNES